jgi:predicted 3-demethylubiquinone-9 3-methyltransferase (glyoxalase superfamily)
VGSVLTIEFELEGQKFVALNGGPLFKFNESISFVVNCEAQEEVDYFWEKLTADGGQESACGWLKDKFGLSWQIVPTVLIEMLQDKDRNKSERVMHAMLQMKKIDINKLKEA